MKELVILSGKGGTGKTSITAGFASLAKGMVLCDADVDAADLHLVLNPEVLNTEDFMGGYEAIINPDKCVQCGKCIEVCRFEAVTQDFVIDPIDCEGCGVCVDLCPEGAIDFPQCISGQWFMSDTRFGPMVHARLGIAQENSGKLVALVRAEARKLAEKSGLDFLLTDGPPGVGCPVIASVSQANLILIVCEPTVSGRHDMQRVVELADHFKIPVMVCINKYDLNEKEAGNIEAFAREKNIQVAGRIPFHEDFVRAMIERQTIFEYDPDSDAAGSIRQIWERVKDFAAKCQPGLISGIKQHI